MEDIVGLLCCGVDGGVGRCVLLEVDVPKVGLIVSVRGSEEGQGN